MFSVCVGSFDCMLPLLSLTVEHSTPFATVKTFSEGPEKGFENILNNLKGCFLSFSLTIFSGEQKKKVQNPNLLCSE